MTLTSRRNFLLLSAAALSAGRTCGAAREAAAGAARLRLPAISQSWRYAKLDYFTGAPVGSQMDRIAAVGQAIEIETRSETTSESPIKYPSWGVAWRHQYFDRDPPTAVLPTEIQEPWGRVLVDPHWPQVQVYEKPIPLWPSELRPGWSTTVSTYYKIPDSEETMPWQLTMHAERWESITVPAGTFTALRVFNLIDFRYTNVSERTAAQRLERIWLAPEIGRWVARESIGTFREDVGYEVKESSYRWELLDWT